MAHAISGSFTNQHLASVLKVTKTRCASPLYRSKHLYLYSSPDNDTNSFNLYGAPFTCDCEMGITDS